MSRLNCLSAGSVSLTRDALRRVKDQLAGLNCLSAGSVSLTTTATEENLLERMSQLPFGWVCFSNVASRINSQSEPAVSIAFRLGLFL